MGEIFMSDKVMYIHKPCKYTSVQCHVLSITTLGSACFCGLPDLCIENMDFLVMATILHNRTFLYTPYFRTISYTSHFVLK